MAEKRRRFFRRIKERDERLARLARIAAATPPSQRDTGDTFERVDDVAEDLDEEVPIAEPATRPALRQEPPPTKTKIGARPWWAETNPDAMTATGLAQRERMETERPRVARSVTGRINE